MRKLRLLSVLILASGVLPGTPDAQTLGTTTRVSTGATGAQANDASVGHAISGNGRHVVFTSSASNLVPGDTNGLEDVFVRDRRAATLTRVSVSTSGGQANGASTFATLSAVGRHVAFTSSASNLVPGDTNGLEDVFVHDRDTPTTTRVSVSTAGTQGDGASFRPALSSDGRYVAFTSDATNLVAGDTNGLDDVFVHDRNTRTTSRISVSSGGVQANDSSALYAALVALSADGRYVAFTSDASSLVPGDTNGLEDILIHDRQTRATVRVSLGTAQSQGNDASYRPFLSADGNFVLYTSDASNLVTGDTNGSADVFVHDRGLESDQDGDGIPDSVDNCVVVPNADQRDTDGDDYGNICDPDLNNDGLVSAADFLILRERLTSTDPDADLNGDGRVSTVDYLILRAMLGQPPGPSGLAP
jgi:Tol biopolymer transport system component